MTPILAGVGAGLVSALLFSTVLTGSVLAIALFYLAPLPVAIVALGWGRTAGLTAAAAGAAAIALFTSPLGGMGFAIGVALPVVWLCHLALMSRRVAGEDGAEALAWYPIGRIGLWAILVSVGLTIVGAIMINSNHQAYLDTVGKAVARVIALSTGGAPVALPGNVTADEAAAALASLVAPVSSAGTVVVLLMVLWGAARIVAASGRLSRPMPVAQEHFALPAFETSTALAVGTLMSFLPGWPGAFGWSLLAATLMALALQGLATVHVITRATAARPFVIATTYLFLVVAMPWALIALSAIGLGDLTLRWRERIIARGARPPGGAA